MPNNNFQDILKYYKEYLDKFYGGLDYLSPQQETYFTEQRKWMQEAGKTAEERALESLYARGIERSGVGTDYLSKYVYEPMAKAEAALGTQRAGLIAQEEARRRGEAMTMALQKYQEEQGKRGGLWRTLGKVGGVALGVGAGLLTKSPQVGLAVGGGAMQAFGGGAGGGIDQQLINQIIEYLNKTGGQGTTTQFLGQWGQPALGGTGGFDYLGYYESPYSPTYLGWR